MNIYNQNQLNLISNRGSMMTSTATSGMIGWPTGGGGGGGGAPGGRGGGAPGGIPPPTSGGEKETVSDEFPAGLRVLVVDDDPTCLAVLEKMLVKCKYEVTLCTRADVALTLLRENKNGYDIVLSDVHMPDMDGFKLLEQIGLEMDLPVIMMSADDAQHVVMKGVTHGAVDYLIKPVRIEPLRNIWQHVIRKLKSEGKDVEQSGSVEEGNNQPKHSEEADYSSSANEGSWRSSRKRKDDEEEGGDERDDTSTLKKPRVVWSVELHQQFVAAVNQLGIDKAVPKRILELMNVPGLTRENVASHLQKYRLYLKRLSGVPLHQNNSLGGNAFINPPEPPFLTLPPIGGMEMQSLAATAQFPAQSLATLQAAGLGRSAVKPRMPVSPPVDQRSLFNLENQKLRFSEGPTQLNSSKQMSLLHGIPTNMEPTAVGSMNMPVNFHGGQGSQSSSFLMQMSQSQTRGQMINETSGSHMPTLPSPMGQSVGPNVIAGRLLGRNGLAVNGRGAGYNPVPQSSPLMNFPLNSSAEISGTSFPLGTSPGMSSLASKGTFQDEVSSGLKEPIGLMPSYDIFADLNQHKSHDWQLPNLGMTFNGNQSSSLQSNFLPSDFSPSQGTEGVGKLMFSAGNATNLVNPSFGQNNTYFDNSVRIKSEILPETDNFFPEQFNQEDLMSAILKQQGGVFPNENDYEYDGYTLDNIPV